MKNIKNILFAAMVSSTGALATLQPMVPLHQDQSFRLSGGVLVNIAKGNDVFGGVNFTHFFSPGLFYGAGLDLGYSNALGFRFADQVKEGSTRMDLELSAGFLPEVGKGFNLGLIIKAGFGRQFGKRADEFFSSHKVSFGDLNVKVGIAMSYQLLDKAAVYLIPSYAMTSIRFFKEDAGSDIKSISRLSGFEIPLGIDFVFFDSEHVSLFLETTTRLLDLNDFRSFGQEFALGISYAL